MRSIVLATETMSNLIRDGQVALRLFQRCERLLSIHSSPCGASSVIANSRSAVMLGSFDLQELDRSRNFAETFHPRLD